MEPKPQKETEQPKPDELNEENLDNVAGGLGTPTTKSAEPINDGKLPAQPPGARSVEPVNG
jgi:hypothetical protein